MVSIDYERIRMAPTLDLEKDFWPRRRIEETAPLLERDRGIGGSVHDEKRHCEARNLSEIVVMGSDQRNRNEGIHLLRHVPNRCERRFEHEPGRLDFEGEVERDSGAERFSKQHDAPSVEAALANGGKDNVTVVVASYAIPRAS